MTTPLLLVLLSSPAADILSEPVPVRTSSDASMFPDSWRKDPIAASGQAITADNEARAKRILASALKKYPPALLKKELHAVYVLSDLKYSGITAGGTNSRTTVYVTMGDPAKGFTDAEVERIVHAEFSSILLRNHAKSFETDAWTTLNPVGFTYLGNGVDAIKQQKAGLAAQSHLNRDGFLKQYSQSTLENDFNGFAALVFSGDAKQWALADAHPKLLGKLKLTLAFYAKLDDTLTEKHFRSLPPS